MPFPCNPVGQRIVCPRQWSHFINIDIAQSIIHHSNLVRHLNLSEIGVLHLDKIRTQSFRYAVKLPLYSNIICAVQFMSSSVYDEFAIVVAFHCPLSNVILSILEPPFCISHQITLNRFKCMDSCYSSCLGIHLLRVHAAIRMYPAVSVRTPYYTCHSSIVRAQNAIEPALTKSNNSPIEF